MPNISRELFCKYPHELLYSIILDIEKYPEFVPWCVYAKIIRITDSDLEADLKANFKGFTSQYRSLVVFNYNDIQSYVTVKMLNGPFKFLNTKWHLEYLEECKVKIKFDIEFEFQSFILENIAKISINKLTDKIMEAFLLRAKKLYDAKANID
jgi:coenzyme Q-binding protein COQ10